MSRSGVQVSQECVEAFNALKLGKSLKFIVFKLNDQNTEIVVEKKSESKDWDEFTGLLPENECRYAVYDFEYEKAGGEGIRNKICFVHWSPDTARIKSKMVSASSKETIKRALSGVGIEVQATDYSEVDHDTVLEKVQRTGF